MTDLGAAPVFDLDFNLVVDVSSDQPAWAEKLGALDQLTTKLAKTVLARVGLDDDMAALKPAVVEVSIRFSSDDVVKDLNRVYRGMDKPTNVLSFAQLDGDLDMPPGAPLMLGDIVLAFETCSREAADQQKPFSDHVSHLIIHGLLHLLGFDHEENDEAEAMEQWEIRLLGEFGLPDPYGFD